MGKQFDAIEAQHERLIRESHIFFVGTAAADGRVSLSPKGGDSLRLLNPTRILWRNITGSGNETAGHLRLVSRMTLMWCSFGPKPMILRAYGTAQTCHAGETNWEALNAHFPPHDGARQVFDMSVDLVQSSCGYNIPFMDFAGDRDTLDRWTDAKGRDGIASYWSERNQHTIDGFPTGTGA